MLVNKIHHMLCGIRKL